MKMAKALTLLMVLLLTLGLMACDSEPGSNPDPSSGDNNDEGQCEEVSIEEQTLVDQDGIIITATKIDASWMGPELQVLIENNSDTSVTVQARNTSVNGFMLEPIFSSDVASGKKATDTLTFSSEDFQVCNIETIADIELSFHVFDTDSWDTIFDTDMVTVETSAAATYTQDYDTSGDVILDQDGIKVIYQGMSENIFGPTVDLFIENNTDTAFTIQARDTSVNGFMIEPTFSSDIMPGKKAVTDLTFFDSDFEDNGIETATDIELSFHIFNMDSWNTILDTEPIQINP